MKCNKNINNIKNAIKDGFIEEMKAFFDEYSVDGIMIYPNITSCYIGVV